MIREIVGGPIPRILFCLKPKAYNWAVTLYPFIFYRYHPEQSHRLHEYIHVEQIRRLGWMKFYFLWIWYYLKFGYTNNPFEVEAFKLQSELQTKNHLLTTYPQLHKPIN